MNTRDTPTPAQTAGKLDKISLMSEVSRLQISSDVHSSSYLSHVFLPQVSRKSRHLRSSVTMMKMVVVGLGSYDPWTTTSQHVGMLSFDALTSAQYSNLSQTL